jgi:hypothetical protein
MKKINLVLGFFVLFSSLFASEMWVVGEVFTESW